MASTLLSSPCFSLCQLGRKKTNTRETVIPDPDYRIPIVLLGLAGGLAYSNNLLPAAPVGLLGALLLFQEVKVGNELRSQVKMSLLEGKTVGSKSTIGPVGLAFEVIVTVASFST
ncbi:hypothetical protein G4B88_015890 [Cannabis sativa]|uniref:Uncharacterized protein n=1 Tax=Cannabis sativa TaxID=3483 RepID=A0A7J6G889_CANSA|nr:hypothetical protein G4B88_015890 [Cannabis sativa]